MFNLIYADLFKETRKKSFKIMCVLIIFVSILYICLIRNVKYKEVDNMGPLLSKSEYLSIYKQGDYEKYKINYKTYVNKLEVNNKLILYNKNRLKLLVDEGSVILYLIGIVIIFKSFHSLSYDYTFKTIRYIFQTSHSRSKILLSKISSQIIISLFIFIISITTMLITSALLTGENIFNLKQIIYVNNEFIKISYIFYLFKYFIYYIPIVFMIFLTYFLTTLFKGNNISLIISNIIYLFSITLFNMSLSYNLKFLNYSFLPYLDMSYFTNNNYLLNNLIYNINSNIKTGSILLIIYSLVLFAISSLLFKRDVD